MYSKDIPHLSGWELWPTAAIEKAPRLPGVYVFRLEGATCTRILGKSDIVYIGATASKAVRGTVRNRLRAHNHKGPDNWTRRVSSQVGPLEVAWRECSTCSDALYLESNLLSQYSRDHIELPPGNRQQSAKSYQEARQLLLQLMPGERQRIIRDVLSGLSPAETERIMRLANVQGTTLS